MKRKPAAGKTPRDQQPASPPPEVPAAAQTCRRCGGPGPFGDEGFCAGCEKALEQACL